MSEPASSPKCDLCGAPVEGNGVCPRRQYTGVNSVYVMPKGCAKNPAPRVELPHAFGLKQEPGLKLDADKIRADLLPVEALEGVSAVLSYGSRKYGERNWEKGMSWSRPYAACLRHLFAWWRGEDNDPETGLSHLDHALCCLLFLSTFVKRRVTTFDDRPHSRG